MQLKNPLPIGLMSMLLLQACGDDGRTTAAVDACVERGVAYYKEIGSYPTLKSPPSAGRLAVDVAKEKCERTLTAF